MVCPGLVLLGDLNGTTDDHAFADLTSQMRSAQDAAGDGFGFSWPARFPLIPIDQILVRGVTPVSSWVLPATGSDHLPVAARISADFRGAFCNPYRGLMLRAIAAGV